MAAPSWSVLDESNKYREVRRAKLQAEYEMWRSCQPVTEEREDEDWTALSAELYAGLGMGKRQITRHLDALAVLDRLPRLKALVEETFLLGMNHLCTIEKAASAAPVGLQEDDYFWRALDEDLIERFTPSRHRQLLPSASAITDVVNSTVRSVEALAAPEAPDPWSEGTPEKPEDPDAPEEDGPQPCENPADLMASLPPPEEKPTSSLHMQDLPDGRVLIELTVDQATGTRIADAVIQAAADQKCSRADALTSLILDGVTTKVTTLVYEAKGDGDCTLFHPERGLLTPAAAAELKKRVTRTIDMDAAGQATTPDYTPTDEIRAYLIGRDWICRWPGCSRKATYCDGDHRINHDDGGPTTAANMIMLCRHHHNRKTDENARYLLDPYSGDVYWLFADGTWAVDEATGPLAPKQKHWVQTFQQRRARRREHLSSQAAGERFEEYQQQINAPPPPPAEKPDSHIPWLKSPPPPPPDPEKEEEPPPF